MEGKAVVRLYNKISYVLVEFEVLYHTAWMKEISQLEYGKLFNPLQTLLNNTITLSDYFGEVSLITIFDFSIAGYTIGTSP